MTGGERCLYRATTVDYNNSLGASTTLICSQQDSAELMKHFYEVHNGLSFFIGGHSVIEVSKPLFTWTYESILDHIRKTVNLELNVELGNGLTAQDAMAAKAALEECRDHERKTWFVNGS
jgi:GTP cyclohydrolase III